VIVSLVGWSLYATGRGAATLIDQGIVDFKRGTVVSFPGTTDERGPPDVASSSSARLRQR
jgi:hypothetical protein